MLKELKEEICKIDFSVRSECTVAVHQTLFFCWAAGRLQAGVEFQKYTQHRHNGQDQEGKYFNKQDVSPSWAASARLRKRTVW